MNKKVLSIEIGQCKHKYTIVWCEHELSSQGSTTPRTVYSVYRASFKVIIQGGELIIWKSQSLR